VIAIVFSVLLWVIAGGLLLLAMRRSDGSAREALRKGMEEFVSLLPRLAIGIISAGFLARLLPESVVAAHLGPETGLLGLALAAIAGGLTPGGPVVGFSIAAAALKAGAGLPQTIAYVTAWGLFSFNRVILWEMPIMPHRFIWMRIAVSLPLPILAGLLAMTFG
jgi:uncharacterized membrane protein YraQ (UPF0718 family)